MQYRYRGYEFDVVPNGSEFNAIHGPLSQPLFCLTGDTEEAAIKKAHSGIDFWLGPVFISRAVDPLTKHWFEKDNGF